MKRPLIDLMPVLQRSVETATQSGHIIIVRSVMLRSFDNAYLDKVEILKCYLKEPYSQIR